MLDQKAINKALEELAERIVEKAKQNLKVKTKTNFRGERWKSTKSARSISASGETGKSLGYEVLTSPNAYGVKFKGKPSTYFTEYGRKPGKAAPTEPIVKWIKAKRIKPYERTESGGRKFVKRTPAKMDVMAYLIARKIGREGTQATYFFEAAVKKGIEDNKDKLMANAINVDKLAEIIKKQLGNISYELK